MIRRQVLVAGAAAAVLLGTGDALAVPATTTTAMPSTTPVATSAAAAGAAGVWGRAIPVPGLAALNKGRNAVVLSVSCPSAGNCGAGGYYHNRGRRGFVVSESNGRWRRAIKVPGLAALSKGGPGQVIEVSCASAGSCAAGGFYTDGSGHQQGFVVGRSNGRWRQAFTTPHPGAPGLPVPL